mmetsp:Transcript_16329/g.38906  ORF Transcript_16329/g.38906 Transcript_16329/m.38906 type:complete len:294 (-) Transcript_16329:833-1714(-)
MINNLVPCGTEHYPLLDAHIQQTVDIALKLMGVIAQQRRSLLVWISNVALRIAEETGRGSAAASSIRRKHLSTEVFWRAPKIFTNIVHVSNISKIVREANRRSCKSLPHGIPNAHVDEVHNKLWSPPHYEQEAHLGKALVREVHVVICKLQGRQDHGIYLENVRKEELPCYHCHPEESVNCCVTARLGNFLPNVETAEGEKYVQEGLHKVASARIDFCLEGWIKLKTSVEEPRDHTKYGKPDVLPPPKIRICLDPKVGSIFRTKRPDQVEGLVYQNKKSRKERKDRTANCSSR